MIQFRNPCILAFLLICCFIPYCLAKFGLSRDYTYSKKLVDGYVVHWSIVDKRTLHLALEVNTLGWIGFGIGELTSGSMAGADMVTGFVDSSGGFITDRWARATGVEPEEDVCQDWTLLSFSEDFQTEKTLLEMSRSLAPQDTRQDRPILDNGFPTRIIGAWGASDAFGKHKTKFTGSINFFADPSEDIIEEVKRKAKSKSKIMEWKMTNGDYQIPAIRDTVYYEFCKNLTEIKQEAHIIAIHPQFDDRSEGTVHHFLIFGHRDSDCKGQRDLIYAWNRGGGPYIFPEETGLRIGGDPGSTKGFHSVYMQTHFDNPKKVKGLVDDSGVVAIATTNLRKYDAGVIMLGDPDTKLGFQKLIPGRSRYVFDCAPGCTKDMRGNITVFKSTEHMHSYGQQMHTEVIRQGRNLGKMTLTEYHKQPVQEATPIEPFTIMPGDHLRTTCFYETDGTVMFGHKTQFEMCLQFLWYYPVENVFLNGHCALQSCATLRRPSTVNRFLKSWGMPPKRNTCAKVSTKGT